ncbi:hypothetical protein SRABI80_00986 [Peribacillus frigoritolerans]|uniref:exosporium leader peptide n=1 Tax=Peribacillus frigoritolerans TaxID=450367 RepID=UPI001D916F20|nr:exosporium leader peptide [Peribacillus frigoritolerans]CAH0166132.1 hypothetical protein SRABI80_00986 [Peribacillus frigoritolerans]
MEAKIELFEEIGGTFVKVSPQPEGLDEFLLIAGEPNNPAVGLTINNPPFTFQDTRMYSTRFTTPDNIPSVSRTFKIVVSFEVTNYLQQPIYSSNPSSLNNPAALQFMVDIFLAPESCIEPPPIATRIVYVNKAGNDATADGSECAPFLTVTAAMASITDAIAPFPDPNNLTKRYAISIGPGAYIEPLIHLKANVQLVGTSALLTRLQIPFDINDPSWFDLNFSQDPRSGFANLSLLTGPLNFNFQLAQSVSGKLFFERVNIAPSPTFTALSTSVNQVTIRDSLLSSGYTQNGINMVMFASFVSSGNIIINSQATTDTQVNLVGGGINGNIIINVQSGHIPIDPLNLTSFAITENIFNPFPNSGRLIVNGVNNVSTRVRATVDSIPIRSRVTLVGTGTTLIRVDDAFGLAYTPAVPADYDPPIPTTVQEALDQLAARVRALGG